MMNKIRIVKAMMLTLMISQADGAESRSCHYWSGRGYVLGSAESGEAVRRGTELAIDKINNNEGVPEREKPTPESGAGLTAA